MSAEIKHAGVDYEGIVRKLTETLRFDTSYVLQQVEQLVRQRDEAARFISCAADQAALDAAQKAADFQADAEWVYRAVQTASRDLAIERIKERFVTVAIRARGTDAVRQARRDCCNYHRSGGSFHDCNTIPLSKIEKES